MSKSITLNIEERWKPYLKDLQSFVRRVNKELTPNHDDEEDLLPYHERLIDPLERPLSYDELEVHFLKHVIVDLAGHGWRASIRKGVLKLVRLEDESMRPEDEKEYIRQRHLRERNAQLLEPSVAKFIEKMECRALNKKGWHSIFSVMRDGRDLGKALRSVRKICDKRERLSALSDTISPYIQFVDRDTLCEHTDLPISDIWRYFRHTWVTTYKTLPGRSMSILIRDAAAPNHPVIGIAALGSSIVQQKTRDLWIGWEPEAVISRLISKASIRDVQWLIEALDQQISGIYRKDLYAEGVITPRHLRNPTEEIIAKLREMAEVARKRHQAYPKAAGTKKAPLSKKEWEARAKADLYISKRASVLADLLSARLAFKKRGLVGAQKKDIQDALKAQDVRRAILGLLRRIKAEHVGIDMMDIIVCGAVPPYNHLLGGKLVCALLASPEVTGYYNARYGNQASVIASSMKGTPVIRQPQLVLLGTTSLYGVGSSQYNRIKIPAEKVGGKRGSNLAYEEVGKSEGYGSFQFSSATLDVMEVLLARSKNGKRVNSIFGEGVNPLMRKLRDALGLIGLPQNEVLRHKRSRIIYGVPLAANFREVLSGRQKKARYIIPQTKRVQKTNEITDYWRERWLVKRINNDTVLSNIESNSLQYPIHHAARVPLYKLMASKEANYEMELEVFED